MDAAVGLFEIFTIGVIWLVFFPPGFYRSWFAEPMPTPEATGATGAATQNPAHRHDLSGSSTPRPTH